MGKSRSIPRSRWDFPSNIFCATWGIKSISPILSKNTTNYCQWITNCKKKQIDTNELTCLVFISYIYFVITMFHEVTIILYCAMYLKNVVLWSDMIFFVEKKNHIHFLDHRKKASVPNHLKKGHILKSQTSEKKLITLLYSNYQVSS